MATSTTPSKQLLDTKFFSRAQIWNQVEASLPNPMPATQAYEKFGHYKIDLRNMWEKDPETGDMTETDLRSIWIKSPTHGFSGYQRAGTVKGRYTPLQPGEIVKLWEENVGLPVEAMGATGHAGHTFFLSSSLAPIFGKKGEEIQCSLVGLFPANGLGSAVVRLVPLRIACTNMIHPSYSKAVMSASITHSGRILDTIGIWMKHLTEESAVRTAKISADLEKLTETKTTKPLIEKFVAASYVTPKIPSQIGPAEVVERRNKEWTNLNQMNENRKAAFYNLLEGQATGSETEAFKGTMFGVLNAATELEQYRNSSKGDSERAHSVLNGPRARKLEGYYNTALTLANGNRVR